MVTSCTCRCSFIMVMKNYTVDTPTEFLSLNLSILTTLTKCFPNFSLFENLFTLLSHKPLNLPIYKYKRKAKKKGLKNAVTRFESCPEAAAFPLKLPLPKN